MVKKGGVSIKSLQQIDILKGLAIIGVIFVHTVPAYLVTEWQIAFNLGQQVPIFIILSGLVMTLSLQKKGLFTCKNNLIKDYIYYFKSRMSRLLPSIFIIFIFSSVIWFICDFILKKSHMYGFGKLTFTGLFPAGGPGSYYIGLLFELTLIFPIFFCFYKRNIKITIISMFLLNIIFEIYIAKFAIFSQYHLYKICILRYFAVLAMGMYLANNINIKSKKNLWIIFLSPISAIYIYLANNCKYKLPFFVKGSWHIQNIGAVFYTTLLVLIGMKFLPKNNNKKIVAILVDFGKKSFHIFLVQMLYFSMGLSIFHKIIKKNVGIQNNIIVYLLAFSIDFILCYILANAFIFLEGKFKENFKRLKISLVGYSEKNKNDILLSKMVKKIKI